MLSESSHSEGETFFEHLSRSRRQADVRRGAVYTRTVDNLADRQWNAHGGLPVTDIQRRATRHSLQPINQGRAVLPSVSVAQCQPLTPTNPVLESQVDETRDFHYNTWGSRNTDLDNKLEPEDRPRVVLPKRGVMMSRVARNNQERPFKTMTNFRSRNGTIRIIEPFNPQPSLHYSQDMLDVDKPFDVVDLQREQTYAMLQRIDQILHPAKMYFKRDLSSSEMEIQSCDSAGPEEPYERSSLQPHQFGPHNDRPRYARKAKTTKPGKNFAGQYHDQSLARVVSRLGKRELDAFQKCQLWLDKCHAR